MNKQVGKAVRAIAAAKACLIKKAKKSGIYENFGDREQRKLYDAHWEVLDNYLEWSLPARTAFQQFRNWCMNYTGR